MQVDQEDRYVEDNPSSGFPKLPLILAAGALVALLAWYFSGSDEPAPPPEPVVEVPAMPVTPAPLPEPTPDIPEPEPVAAPEPVAEEPAPPPEPELTLAESDEPVREAMTPLLADSSLALTLENDSLLERGAALISATSMGQSFYKVLKLSPPAGDFAVTGEGEELYIDPASYQRYDSYAQAIGALDVERMTALFHQFRPLLEQAYAGLGYPAEELDNSLIRALDQIASAPVLQHPPLVEQHVATYLYADESLESLTPLAKQILRMGPENQAIVQRQARALRAALLQQPASD